MTKKGSSSNGSSSFGGHRFVNVQLSRDDKERLAEIASSGGYPIDLLGDLLSVGIKVSFSSDKQGHGSICSFTDTREGSPSAKCILTGRGTTPFDAWLSVCFKHYEMAKEDWRTLASLEESSGSRFG